MYTVAGSWPRAAELAARLGCRAALLAEVSGGNPFDEAVSRPWFEISDHFPDAPLPPAPLSATIELRGVADVDEDLAERDARNLLDFFRSEGIVCGDPENEAPPACEATPLAGVEHLRATAAGLVSHCVDVGEHVEKGATVARIIDPLASFGEGIVELCAGTSGLVYARTHHRIVSPGMVVTGIAGREPLAANAGAHLLSD
jgi:predicted deacylase